MAAAAVVERFDPFEARAAGLVRGGEARAVDKFEFEGGEERLGLGVIVAVGAAAHGGVDVAGGQFGAEAFGGRANASNF